MKITHATSLLHALKNHPHSGAGVVTLSAETGIEATQLRQYLLKYPDFFTNVAGTSKYVINEDNHFHGDAMEMLMDLEFRQQRANRIKNIVIALIALLVGIICGYLLNSAIGTMFSA